MQIVRPSPALRVGDHRPRAASIDRTRGKSKRYAACAKHGGFAAIPVNYQGIWLLLTDR